jgi:molybdenum cofactor guanylyltransferase
LHQKHSNIAKASFGNFARHEIAFLGTPCNELKIWFDRIIANLPHRKFAIIEADHKADTGILAQVEYTDKINFQRLDYQHNANKFDRRVYFENIDLALVNGNHFEANAQILFVDSRKSIEKKLEKLTNVQLIILVDTEIPPFLLQHFGAKLPRICRVEEKDAILASIEIYIQQRIPPLFGLVLAGGKSSRMGHDKSEIKYHGTEQRKFVFHMLSQVCNENVFLSLNEKQITENKSESPFIQDTFLGLGPMGGILSAFQLYPDVAWLTIACDMPFLTKLSINQLVGSRNPSKLATAFFSPDNEFPEPLITIWEPKAYPKLLQMLAYGYDCPRKVLLNSDIQLVKNTQDKELQNINTVEQFEKAIIDLSPKIA